MLWKLVTKVKEGEYRKKLENSNIFSKAYFFLKKKVIIMNKNYYLLLIIKK